MTNDAPGSTPQPEKQGCQRRTALRPVFVLLSGCALFGSVGVWHAIQGCGPASQFDSATLVGPGFVWLSLVRGNLLPALAIIVSTVLLVTGSDLCRPLSLRCQRAFVVGLVPIVVVVGVAIALAAAAAASAAYGVELADFAKNARVTASDTAVLVSRAISGGVVLAIAWRWVQWRERRRVLASPSAVARDAGVACVLSIAAEFALATGFLELFALFA